MPNKTIAELSSITSLANEDLLLVYDFSEAGAEKVKNISVPNAFEGYATDGELNAVSSLVNAISGTLQSHTHDGRYYTETELDAGQLDNRYYTETELNNGQLDSRYYTETEVDTISGALNIKISTASGTLQNQLNNLSADKLYFGSSKVVETMAGGISIYDSAITNKLDIIHDGTHAWIKNKQDGGSILITGENSSGVEKRMFWGEPTSNVKLYYNGTASFQTEGNGFAIYNSDISAQTQFLMENGSNALLIRNVSNAGGNIYLQPFKNGAGNQGGVYIINGGSVDLYYDGVKKFETTATGATITGNLIVTGGTVATQSYVDTVSGALNIAKAGAVHTHDDRYYTEGEVDTISGALNSAKLNITGGNINGSLTITGDLSVQGDNFIADTQTVLVEDNLIVINKNEVGAGVTAGVAGIEVERGSLTNYQFYFDEGQDNFRVGVSGSLQAVATREDTPTSGGVATWNASQYRFDTTAVGTAFNKNFGTTSGTICQGDDSRLSDARTPTTHNHDSSYYTKAQTDTISGALNTSIGTKFNTSGGQVSGNFSVAGSTKADGYFYTGTTDPTNATRLNYDGYFYATRVYNTYLNDIADFQKVIGEQIPGKCYYDTLNGALICSARCQKSVIGILSDTFGIAAGVRNDPEYGPIAVAGWALAYVDDVCEPGDVLTNGPSGNLVKMTREEKLECPERIVATYKKPETTEFWGPNNEIKVNGRHWVKVR